MDNFEELNYNVHLTAERVARMERVILGEKLNGENTPGLLHDVRRMDEYITRLKRIEYVLWGAMGAGLFSGGATVISLLERFKLIP